MYFQNAVGRGWVGTARHLVEALQGRRLRLLAFTLAIENPVLEAAGL